MSTHYLLVLAHTTISDEAEVRRLSVMPAPMREAIERQMAEAQAEATEQAASEVLSLMKDCDTANIADRTRIRALRAQIARLKAQMDARDLALDYGMATGNYVPAMRASGKRHCYYDVMTHEEYERLSTVPEGWTAPAEQDTDSDGAQG